ncbi:MAG: hypothetical protein H5T92_00140 [Synergistales bacterium]|nr:hypothetical protein [Synergistales bacterium]
MLDIFWLFLVEFEPMSQYDEYYDDGYIPEWKRYPVERCVMTKEKNERFRQKCRELNLPKSRVINNLIDLWLKGKVEV